MLKVRNASLRYTDQVVFEDLNFELSPHKWLAIMGASGVGKTSLLRLIVGLHHFRAENNTKIEGAVTWQDQSRFEVSYMAQQDGLFPWLSVWDNVLLPFHLSGDAVTADTKGLIAAVGLEDSHKAKPKALSGGMRQRVALARTLIQHRDVVLMDEPFSALDAMTRMEMQNLSSVLMRRSGKTVVMVTHDPWEALRLADSILILAGRPARVLTVMDLPETNEVRDVTDPEVIRHYQSLMAFF